MRSGLAQAALALAFACEVAGAGEPVLLEASVEWPNPLPGGYFPVSVTVTNPGPALEGVVRLEPAFSGGNAVTVERRVSVAAGAAERFTLPVPVGGWGRYKALIAARGRVGPGTPPTVDMPGTASGYGRPTPTVIAVAREAPDLRELTAAARGSGHAYGSPSPVHVRPEAFPDLWQPLSSISLCVLDVGSLPLMRSGQKRTLREWVTAGGVCLMHPVDGGGEDAALAELGFAGAERWPQPRRDGFRGDVRAREVGLGRCLFMRRDAFPGREAAWKRLLSSPGLKSLAGRSSKMASQDAFPIPGVGTPPVIAFVVIAVLFVIAIGPVNWYVVLCRMKNQALFLFSTPAIALVTALLLLAYSFISEGFGTHARIESVAVLDAGAKRGTTWSRHAIYSGFAPRGGLRFDASTLVLPLTVPESRRAVSWSDGQRLAGGWLPARTYVSYLTCAHYPARWRVTVEERAGRFLVLNGLPCAMELVAVKTANGTVYAREVAAGGEGALLSLGAGEERAAFYIASLAQAFDLSGSAGAILRGLPPGSFVARLDGPLGAELGVSGYREAEGRHVVIGVAGGE